MQRTEQRPDKYSWSSDVIYRRPTNEADFMLHENVLDRTVCQFYSGFRTNPPPNTPTKIAKYHVGDTVMFEGDSCPLSAGVGVIIGMYGIVAEPGSPDQGERKRVKIHRFVRDVVIDGVLMPSHPRQLYYSCSGSVIVRPTHLLRHCKVINERPLDQPTDYFCPYVYDEQQRRIGNFDWIAHRNLAKSSRHWDIILGKAPARKPVDLGANESEPAYKKFKGVGGQVEAAAAQQQRQSGPSGSSNANTNPIERPSSGLPDSKKRTLSEMQITSNPRARPDGQVAQAGMPIPAAGAQIRNPMIQMPPSAPAMRTMYDPYGRSAFHYSEFWLLGPAFRGRNVMVTIGRSAFSSWRNGEQDGRTGYVQSVLDPGNDAASATAQFVPLDTLGDLSKMFAIPIIFCLPVSPSQVDEKAVVLEGNFKGACVVLHTPMWPTTWTVTAPGLESISVESCYMVKVYSPPATTQDPRRSIAHPLNPGSVNPASAVAGSAPQGTQTPVPAASVPNASVATDKPNSMPSASAASRKPTSPRAQMSPTAGAPNASSNAPRSKPPMHVSSVAPPTPSAASGSVQPTYPTRQVHHATGISSASSNTPLSKAPTPGSSVAPTTRTSLGPAAFGRTAAATASISTKPASLTTHVPSVAEIPSASCNDSLSEPSAHVSSLTTSKSRFPTAFDGTALATASGSANPVSPTMPVPPVAERSSTPSHTLSTNPPTPISPVAPTTRTSLGPEAFEGMAVDTTSGSAEPVLQDLTAPRPAPAAISTQLTHARPAKQVSDVPNEAHLSQSRAPSAIATSVALAPAAPAIPGGAPANADITMKQSVSPEEPIDRKYDPDFGDSEGTVILISSDAVNYRLHPFTLRTTSSYFRQKLQSQQTSFTLTEPSKVLGKLLRIISGLGAAKWDNLEEVDACLAAAHKYGMSGALDTIRALILPAFYAERPMEVYAIAARYEWEEEAKLSSKHTLTLDLYDEAQATKLASIPAPYLIRLFQLHRTRREKFREHIWRGGKFFGITLCPLGCGEQHPRNDALEVLMHAMVREMEKQPAALELLSGQWREWPAYRNGGLCPQRTKMQGPGYGDKILEETKACLNGLPMTI